MREVSEEEMLEAIKFAHEAIKIQCEAIKEMTELTGKSIKRVYCHENNNEELRESIKNLTYDKAYKVARRGNPDKLQRKKDLESIKEEFITTLTEPDEPTLLLVDR